MGMSIDPKVKTPSQGLLLTLRTMFSKWLHAPYQHGRLLWPPWLLSYLLPCDRQTRTRLMYTLGNENVPSPVIEIHKHHHQRHASPWSTQVDPTYWFSSPNTDNKKRQTTRKLLEPATSASRQPTSQNYVIGFAPAFFFDQNLSSIGSKATHILPAPNPLSRPVHRVWWWDEFILSKEIGYFVGTSQIDGLNTNRKVKALAQALSFMDLFMDFLV